LEKMYHDVVKKELQKDQELESVQEVNKMDLKTFSVKYLGITDGKIGILSRKLPLTKNNKKKPHSFREEPRRLNTVKSVPVI